MGDVAQIKASLTGKFEFLAEKVNAPRAKRLFVEAPLDKFRDVLEYAVKELGFTHLVTITGMDHRDALGAIYHLSQPDGTLLNLSLRVSRDAPVISSVTDLFPGGANYERELVDLFGFTVEGVPPGKRYPLPDDWPSDQHPLRKDWKPTAPAAS